MPIVRYVLEYLVVFRARQAGWLTVFKTFAFVVFLDG